MRAAIQQRHKRGLADAGFGLETGFGVEGGDEAVEPVEIVRPGKV